MMPTRSPRVSASSIECVVRRTVDRAFSALMSSHTCALFIGSMPLVGSSSIVTRGPPTNAIATDSRRCMPPDSWPAGLSASSPVSLTCSSSCGIRREQAS
eukprot:1301118-Prymnesium_polylepis.2